MGYRVQLKLDSGKIYDFTVELSDRATTHFTMDETINKSASTAVKAVFTPRSLLFLQLREDFRNDYYARYGKGMRCTSCYREQAFNASVKGEKNSLHLKMLAADLETGQPVSDSVFNWCLAECKKLEKKYGTVMELGRYRNPDRIHIGMDITYQKTTYTFDKR